MIWILRSLDVVLFLERNYVSILVKEQNVKTLMI